MTRGITPIARATIAILALQGTVLAGTIYQWTGNDGQSHFSDTPPPGYSTVIRDTGAGNKTDSGGQGLRHGERRVLDRLAQQAERRRQTRQSQNRMANQRRTEQQQSCRGWRQRLHNTRDGALRKHYASELRKHCW